RAVPAAGRAVPGAGHPAAAAGRASRRDRRARAALTRFAAVMESVHAVQPGWTGWPDAETVICRCEEVTLGELRTAISLGADDARSAKLLARPGMGWCQGRMCGHAVSAIVAAAGGQPDGPGDAGGRPLAQPVPLRVLAALAGDGDAADSAAGDPAGPPE
ncbi:MAG TPA: (2Fe-2S)-binding protein, partial [Streptosporangiaceae bacterium]